MPASVDPYMDPRVSSKKEVGMHDYRLYSFKRLCMQSTLTSVMGNFDVLL